MLHHYRFQKRHIVWGHRCDFGKPNGGDSPARQQDMSWVFVNPVKSSKVEKKFKISFTKSLHKTSQITGVWRTYSQDSRSQYSERKFHFLCFLLLSYNCTHKYNLTLHSKHKLFRSAMRRKTLQGEVIETNQFLAIFASRYLLIRKTASQWTRSGGLLSGACF